MAVPARRLGAGRKLAVLLVPWTFMVVFGLLYFNLLLPRALDGRPLAIVVALFVAMVFVSFGLAAITFSRDVVTGHYPS